MIKKPSSCALLMFVIGLFSQTQIRVIGSIGISELVMFVLAPYLFFKNLVILRRERVTAALGLIVMAMIGCFLSSYYNGTLFFSAIRGFASPYGLWACTIVFYLLLRKSPFDFKWYLLGSAISYVLCIFVFQQAVEVYIASGSGLDKATTDQIMSGANFWISRMGGFVMWPIQGLYMSCPYLYSLIGSFVFGAWSMLTSASGRSTALVALMTTALIFIGRKNRRSMFALRRAFVPMLIGGVVFVFLFTSIYTFMAQGGHLGEKAQAKLENQTHGKKDILSILMGGRKEVFMGAYACMDQPLFGYGPWAVDRKGLVAEYLFKYGAEEDVQELMNLQRERARLGISRVGGIPAHSAIIGWWLWYGALGIPFWIYFIYLFVDLMRKRIGTVPEFFGYFACVLPTSLWSIVFSPFGGRIGWAFTLAMVLINRKIDMDMRGGRVP